jgi:uncharacterized protein (TIGR01244 family)
MTAKHTTWVALVTAATAHAASSIPERLPADAIPNYSLIEPGLAAAGQPSAKTLAKLKDLGFKTVVNLRPLDEAPIVAEEQKIVEAQGIRYVSVPVTAATFSRDDVERVRRVLEDSASAPVLLHCASSNRVGAVWGVIARERGRSLDDAETEAKRAGLTSPAMIEAFRKVAADSRPTAQPGP